MSISALGALWSASPAATTTPEDTVPIGEHWWQIGSGLTAINMDTLILTWVVILIILVPIFFLSRRFSSGVPSGLQNAYEYLVEFVRSQTDQTLGASAAEIFPIGLAMFTFILLSNYIGLIPIPYLKSPTSDLNTTMALGLFTFFLCQYIAIRERGVGGHFKHLNQPSPVFFIINVIDELARPITLSFRLFGNILAGEIMILVLQFLLRGAPFFLLLPMPIWIAFSMFVSLIQAFIFFMLLLAYVSLSFLHDEAPAGAEHHDGQHSAVVR
jgi:F-type H+-transporting ATPase subunit a